MDQPLIDFNFYPIRITLKSLLRDKSTKKNIIWATNTYEHLGESFDDRAEIREATFTHGFALHPRTSKSSEIQLDRTRKKAEVYTPSWVVNFMNNYCDEVWFGRKDVFNVQNGESWQPVREKIIFPEGKSWQDYVDSRRLEITCGEGPYLVSRYDATTSEIIRHTIDRIGFLDRKLRIVDENTTTKEEWILWATRALMASYGYEYQGDSLLIARINVLLTFVEYFERRWDEDVDKKTLQKLANIISWNLWQMDGLSDTVPFGAPRGENSQMGFSDLGEIEESEKVEPVACRIFDWKANKSQTFASLKENI
ncbi:restriction endonuclease subunit M [Anaerococcus sp. Marseille-Q7828]|uniref:restriction endonuclease subunit M n=1 Tax=Anaerococcus sp. Marseille-Q7828 TaxID=3036300 RepID=UPI0024AD820D|nr:restriction endonuclease subunit M [Anaerococcus sp. Marseille-Q7828]